MSAEIGPLSAVGTMAGFTLAFSVKHFVADFVLQTGWMAHGKEGRTGWLVPLVAHALIHAGLALLICLVVLPRLWWLAILDFTTHIIIDWGKSLVGRWGGWDSGHALYWWLFGLDQFLHQVTNIALAAILATG